MSQPLQRCIQVVAGAIAGVRDTCRATACGDAAFGLVVASSNGNAIAARHRVAGAVPPARLSCDRPPPSPAG